MSRTYDIAVLGATPAGFAAACKLAGKGLDVVVLDAPQQNVRSPLADWVPRDFFAIEGLPKGLMRASGAAAFRHVCYHNVAVDKQAEYKSRSIAGYFFRADDLLKAFKSAAVKVGVKVRTTKNSPSIRLEEDRAQLLVSSQAKITCRILIVAQNRPVDVINDLSLPVRAVPQSSVTVAGLDIPAAGKSALRSLAGTLHLVGLSDRTEMGMFFALGPVVHLRVISTSNASANRVAKLAAMVSSLQEAGVLPERLQLNRARGAAWKPPAGVALELETHVAKRCLLAGTAGGFADSITAQVLPPSVKSALLAAGIAANALDGDDVQNTLMKYKNTWRNALAKVLRPPNTSLQMLLPLLFVNRRIVGKFTRALLYGEAI